MKALEDAALRRVLCLLAALILSLQTGNRGHAEDRPAAEEKTREAAEALKAGDYERAARLYERALSMWKDMAARGAPVEDRIRHCQTNLVFALSRPLEDRLRAARELAEMGQAEEASQSLLMLARKYQELAARVGAAQFRQNRKYCLNQAYMVLVQAADKHRGAGRHGQAARLYELALQRLDLARPVLDPQQAKQSEAYLRHWLAVEKFQQQVAAREQVPDLELRTFEGAPLRLSSFRGRYVVVVFWAAWCNKCANKLPYLDLLYQALRERGLAVIGVCVDRLPAWDRGKTQAAREFARTSLSFPCVWADERLMQAFGNPGTVPTVVIIDPNGRFRAAPASDRVHAVLSEIVRELAEDR